MFGVGLQYYIGTSIRVIDRGPIFTIFATETQEIMTWFKKSAQNGGRNDILDTPSSCHHKKPPPFRWGVILAIFYYKTGEKCHFWPKSAHPLRCEPYIYIYMFFFFLSMDFWLIDIGMHRPRCSRARTQASKAAFSASWRWINNHSQRPHLDVQSRPGCRIASVKQVSFFLGGGEFLTLHFTVNRGAAEFWIVKA